MTECLPSAVQAPSSEALGSIPNIGERAEQGRGREAKRKRRKEGREREKKQRREKGRGEEGRERIVYSMREPSVPVMLLSMGGRP